jgi:sterol desaturase/sphingolipid hydroxylase (fatty acid hydroxylase superfamily)
MTSTTFITQTLIPFTWWRIIENLSVYAIVCGIIDTFVRLSSSKTIRNFLSKRKYSSTFPPTEFMIDEALRGIRSVMIGTLYEAFVVFCIHYLYPMLQVDVQGIHSEYLSEWTISMYLVAIVFILIGNELHFYWTHRMLHSVDYLYRHVHSVHHLSKNMDVWSGQSFHSLEAAIFYSSWLLLPLLNIITGWPIPHILCRAMMIGLIISPGLVHQAHDYFGPVDPIGKVPSYDPYWIPSPYAHFIHHQRVIYNFGGYRITDEIFGTGEPASVREEMMRGGQ